MQNSGNSIVKVIISVLAIVCIALIVIFIVNNKPDCSGSNTQNDVDNDDYGYFDDYLGDMYTSDGDITFDDNNTEEMDSIPNDAAAPSASDMN